jgi:hypothetical protein
MAELSIFIVPRDPRFVPDGAAVRKAKASLRRYFPWAEEPPKADVFEQARFFYGYDACDRYTCPACAKTVTSSEVDARAGDGAWSRMLEAARLAPDALAYMFAVPCCNEQVHLHDMVFTMQQSQRTAAIGTFRLRLSGVDDLLSDERISRLGASLGGDVQQVVAVWA